MKVLIIYENIPESTDLYLEEVSDKEWKWLQLTHGCYINYGMPKANQKACNKLNEWLMKKTKIEIKVGKPLELEVIMPIAYIIHTGFGM